ncbi:MAG: hydrolase TatD [Candidatus Vogelbacteria bacterium CG10_big_fil_rev_8_21_14_0_10_50_13]|uniref:Hydrolase TatD n=1 Tax=Candidatus Vogelbacteria bacterium CG10_big_fil_rev_8_21_14_0_10_50_13 TaxID=1975044 RepID=A0A2H0RGP9_9BACT|nr:MAG: hydrolase TatD [Candidatus Vogelbacteria bacterium CG10_big_fil_rev_8_21_14_0_10_50_13]
MHLIDIHAHLNFPEYDGDRGEVIKRIGEAEIGVINVGTDLETSRAVVKLAEENDNMWATVGIHPHHCQGDSLTVNWGELEKLAKHPWVVAIGECGLDYFRLKDNDEAIKQKQRELFIKQIELARQIRKPLMLHTRETYDEVLEILNTYPAVRAHAHFFAGNSEQLQKFLTRGDTISFTGVITFTRDYDELIKQVPLDRLMAETDSPYVAPVPNRGRRNEPFYVREVVTRLAELKGVSPEALAQQTLHNADKAFNLGLF